MKITGFIFGVLLLTGCTKQSCKESVDHDCICTLQYDPVCGCNDVTYGNECAAECNGIDQYTSGECP